MSRENVAVVGVGYVGLTAAACLAHLGRTVTAFDHDEERIALLRSGVVPILEAGLEELVSHGLASGNLVFSTSQSDCITAEIVLFCLPTPHTDHHGPDLTCVEQAARSLGPLLQPGAVIVTKSTVPVGTHEQLKGWLGRPDLHVASNPEFLREGTAVEDFLNPDRIVIGCQDPGVGDRVAAVYEGIDAPVVTCDPTSAELIKYGANSFLATKISFINELSRLCDDLGGDIEAVAAGIGHDHRIGPAFLKPGPGWGGSCFPKDTRGLTHLARTNGHYLPVAESAYASNLDHSITWSPKLSEPALAECHHHVSPSGA